MRGCGLLGACVLWACWLAGGSRVFPLIDSAGRPAVNTRLQHFVDSSRGVLLPASSSSSSGSRGRVVGLVDCTLPEGSQSLNAVLGTSFRRGAAGMSMAYTKNGCFFHADFDHIMSKGFCGAKVIDFFADIVDTVCVVIPLSEWSESMIFYEQLFRRLALQQLTKSNDELTVHVILECPDNYHMTKTQCLTAVKMVKERMDEYYSESKQIFVLKSPENISDVNRSYFANVTLVNFRDVGSLSLLRGRLFPKLGISRSTLVHAKKPTPSMLLNTWKRVSSGVPERVLSLAELKSLQTLEMAYALSMKNLDEKISQWRSRVNSGKVVSSFGFRVAQFQENLQEAFMSRTASSITVRERANKLKQLREELSLPVTILYQQQILILRTQSCSTLMKRLIKAAESKEGLAEEKAASILRDCILNFQSDASSLAIENSPSTQNSDAVQDVVLLLENLCKDFPNSSAGKVAAIRRLEKKVKDPPPKGKRGVSVALSLVGFFRPPGFGNFQCFFNYITNVFGLPLDLVLGSTNDGEDVEIGGISRENPLFRVQPKFHFDINV